MMFVKTNKESYADISKETLYDKAAGGLLYDEEEYALVGESNSLSAEYEVKTADEHSLGTIRIDHVLLIRKSTMNDTEKDYVALYSVKTNPIEDDYKCGVFNIFKCGSENRNYKIEV